MFCYACATGDPAVNITEYIPANHRTLFEIADRGGLSMPIKLCFVITAVAVQCYSVITSDKFIKRKLLSHINSRAVFVATVLGLFDSSDTLCSMVYQKCAKNHKNFE